MGETRGQNTTHPTTPTPVQPFPQQVKFNPFRVGITKIPSIPQVAPGAIEEFDCFAVRVIIWIPFPKNSQPFSEMECKGGAKNLTY